MIAGHSARSQQPLQFLVHHGMVQRLYQLFAQPQLAVFGTDAQVGDIQCIPVRLVRCNISICCNL
ncbi:hypothetical protein D3C75_1150420 [compost metagenome]